MKSIILANFSEHLNEQALPHLREEHFALHNKFEKKWHKRVRFIDQKDFDPAWVLKNFTDYGKDIRVFYFSGHSSDKVLKFYNGDGNKEALATTLNTLAREFKLQCVVLNGCSNLDIAKSLVDVPVVIGTESPIEDKAASEFGVAFFENLIANKSSYQGAFSMAIGQALGKGDESLQGTSITRDILEDEYDVRNKWVCIEKEKGLATTLKFDFASLIPKWVWAVMALLFGFLFYWFALPPIMFAIKGYVAPDFRDGKECKVLVEDFLGTNVAEFNDLLVLGIDENEVFKKNVQALAINDFDDLIYKNKVDQNELPGLADYDYNLYGDIAPRTDSDPFKIDFKVYPKQEISNSASIVYLEVLQDIDNLVSNIDSAQVKLKLLTQVCTTCAYDNEDMVAVAEKVVDSYADSSPEDAQKSYLVLGETSRRHENKAESYELFNKASSADMPDTDVAIAALQASEVYEVEDKLYARAYNHQSEVVNRMQARMNTPWNYKLKQNLDFYDGLQRKYLLKRSENVLNNVDKMQVPKADRDRMILASINDYQYLNNLGVNPAGYESQISALYAKLEAVPEDKDEDGFTNLGGDCDDNDAKINPDAEEICGNDIDENCNGEINEGCNTTPPPAPPREDEEDEIFKQVEEMPRFKNRGCEAMANTRGKEKCAVEVMQKYISKSLQYPKAAMENGVEGKCVVQFVVNENGRITDAEVLRDIGAGCGEEAIRIVNSMPAWVPGKQRGKAVKVYYNLPVDFKIPEVIPPPEEDPTEVYDVVEEMPRFKDEKCEAQSNLKGKYRCAQNAMKNYLEKQLKYPKAAVKNKIEGKCVVQFVVDTNGKITDAKVLRDIGAGCGNEALRIVKSMSAWVPGKHRGKVVKVQYSLPVTFKIPVPVPNPAPNPELALKNYSVAGKITFCGGSGPGGFETILINETLNATITQDRNMYSFTYKGKVGEQLQLSPIGEFHFVDKRKGNISLGEKQSIRHDIVLEKQLPYALQLSGQVLDNNGKPLPGTNVLIKGTTTGTTTDFDGNFQLSAKNPNICSSKIVISYQGYSTQELNFEKHYEQDSEGIFFPAVKLRLVPR